MSHPYMNAIIAFDDEAKRDLFAAWLQTELDGYILSMEDELEGVVQKFDRFDSLFQCSFHARFQTDAERLELRNKIADAVNSSDFSATYQPQPVSGYFKHTCPHGDVNPGYTCETDWKPF